MDLPWCLSTVLTYHHVTAQFWPTIMSQHSSDLPSCHRTVLTYHNVTAQFWPTIMSQHNSISPQLSLILIREHASGTFIDTTSHTRAEGKVAGNISSEYMKQLRNTLDEIHSHHARRRENWKDYQHHICTYTHTVQNSNLKQIKQTGAGSIITTVTKHQYVIMGVNHHYIQGIQAILKA